MYETDEGRDQVNDKSPSWGYSLAPRNRIIY